MLILDARDKEGAYSKEIHNTHEQGQDATRNDDLPEREPERLAASRRLIQIAENQNSENHHGESERDKAGCEREEGPVA